MESKNALPVGERIALYHQLKREEPTAYNFEVEKELNQYGYSLLFAGQPEDAIEIFKLLVSEFPADANPYDSLAEAYKKHGNEALAIANYEKSLAINPDNANARFEVDVMTGRLDILQTDWGKEIFAIPLPFARSMNLVGFEDARFTKGWAKPDSDEFWSYVFAWKIDHEGAIPEELLERNISLYFEGLMSNGKESLESTAVTEFTRVGTSSDPMTFTGTTDFMDTRLTKDRLTLNVQVESRQCSDQGKAVIVFWFSPKPHTHAIWSKLNTVKVLPDICSR
jgi:tetratricopeptide (TPR) repeat protein